MQNHAIMRSCLLVVTLIAPIVRVHTLAVHLHTTSQDGDANR